MTITALPTPPSTSDPANFDVRADTFLGALPTFATEANALASAVNADAADVASDKAAAASSASAASGSATAAATSAASALNAPGTSATSATSLAIGTGSKSLTIQTGKAFAAGQRIVIADAAAPTVNVMYGAVSSYDSGAGALVAAVDAIAGSGTKTSWVVSLSPGTGLGGGDLTGDLGLAAETSVASASTCDIGAANTNKVAITGTTTITSFGTRANRLKVGRFAGALTLTHNATSLILPTGSNITTQAGDTFIATSDGSGNWTVLQYRRADALLQGNGVKFPAAQVASSDPNTQDDYEEGTFTPTLTPAVAPTGQTYTNQLGSYTKSGRRVSGTVRITLSSKGTGGSGAITLGGLPFTPAASLRWACVIGPVDQFSITSGSLISAAVIGGSTDISLREQSNTTNGALTWSQINNAFELVLSFQYDV